VNLGQNAKGMMITPPRVTSFRRPLLAILATLFAAATALYSVLWMYNVRWRAGVELGFDDEYVASQHCDLIKGVLRGSPAEKAGLMPGDRIVEINGRRLRDSYSISDEWARHRPGDGILLTIKRPNVSLPFVVKGIFRAGRDTSQEGWITRHFGEEIVRTYPVAFLVVGLAVLFLRLEDRNAWLLALMFAGFIAIADSGNGFAGLRPSLRVFALIYRASFDSLVPALFYVFFAVFPTRSPLDRRLPWLKWMALVLAGYFNLPPLLSSILPTREIARWVRGGYLNIPVLCFLYGLVALGLLSLIWNAIGATTQEARRKTRVILWGTLVGVVPATLYLAATDFLGFRAPLWLVAALILLLWIFPLSFAYAVVKHRVLEIPVLLKRSARYLLVQRGFLFLHILVSVGAAAVFAWGLSRAQFVTPVGLTGGVIFGSVLAFGGIRIHKATSQRIDRAFFRHAYDARRILEDLVEKTRTATDRNELAALLEHHLRQALQPVSFAVYLEMSDGQLSAAGGSVPPGLQTIPASQPMLVELARHGRPWEVSSSSNAPQPFVLAPLQPDCLVPILGRDGRLVGLVILGQRLSEEPYSREDKQLLASVASQAGVGLESIRLGEKIAERLEAERRVAQEMEYAREVQARLFPQKSPRLETLEYTGGCVQARQVGGDYYDFLELRPGRVALVLADIAGKGISGALLMANLQANLRSQYAMALDDLPRLLKSVNQLFYENTSESSYATLFFADYDDSSRRLRYVNCGHLPPILLRAGEGSPDRGVIPAKPVLRGSGGAGIQSLESGVIPAQAGIQSVEQPNLPPAVERLQSTCTVLGLFDRWECSLAEVQLAPGDTLVMYTDGVTEAASEAGEEFGEDRLIEILRCQRHLPVPKLLETIVAKVQEFSDRKQADDITLVIARCKA
jgi:sigma-B regulation protein RsbU (phosphoserine phosphatase)